MSETKRIIDQLNRAFYAKAWHGPSVMEALNGVSAARAAARPIRRAHTIWEIAHHIGVWNEVVRRRIAGEPVKLAALENFPRIAETTPAAWKRTLMLLEDRHKALVKAVAGVSDRKLATRIRPGGRTLYTLIHGVVQHDVYHAGQIMLLKKIK